MTAHAQLPLLMEKVTIVAAAAAAVKKTSIIGVSKVTTRAPTQDPVLVTAATERTVILGMLLRLVADTFRILTEIAVAKKRIVILGTVPLSTMVVLHAFHMGLVLRIIDFRRKKCIRTFVNQFILYFGQTND